MATDNDSTSDTITLNVRPWPDTPEGVIELTARAFNGNPSNLINCLLERARTAAIALNTQFFEEDDCILNSHIVSGILWDIEGHIQMVKHVINPPEVSHVDD